MSRQKETEKHTERASGFSDYLSLAISTFGVGYIPPAPGTLGSIVGVFIYLVYDLFLGKLKFVLLDSGWVFQQYSAFFTSLTAILLAAFCLIAIFASTKTAKLLDSKDPQIIVVDEVIGQLIVFVFVPFGISFWLVFAGFILFRIFDIWKPYPVNVVENLPNGLGICADDLVAGVYAGACLSFIYWVSLSF